jgi:hypothetical protein
LHAVLVGLRTTWSATHVTRSLAIVLNPDAPPPSEAARAYIKTLTRSSLATFEFRHPR